MAAVDLPLPGVAGRPGTSPGPGVITVDAGDGCSLRVFDAGLACCGVEVAAALRRSGSLATATAGKQLNVFIVAGTVTDKLAPYVLEAFQATPLPRRVLSFGACANSGVPTGTPTASPRAWTSSSRWTSTFPAARRGRRRCWPVWRWCCARGSDGGAGGDHRRGRRRPAARGAVRGRSRRRHAAGAARAVAGRAGLRARAPGL